MENSKATHAPEINESQKDKKRSIKTLRRRTLPPQTNLSRREFLKRAGGALALIGHNTLTPHKSEGASPRATTELVPSLDWEKRKQFLLEMKEYRESLPNIPYQITLEWIKNRADQMLPYFESKNIINQTMRYKKFELMIKPGPYEEAELSMVTGSYAKTLYYNQRMVDPNSNWSKDVSATLTLIAHELYHLQSQNALYDEDNAEASAQINALVVLSSIAGDPNAKKDLALEAKEGFALELEKWIGKYQFYEALRDTAKREDYITFYSKTYQDDPDRLRKIFTDYDLPEYAKQKREKEEQLNCYSVLPYKLFTNGVQIGHLLEGDVLLPANHKMSELINRLHPDETSIPLLPPAPEEAKAKVKLSFAPVKAFLKEIANQNSQSNTSQHH